MLLGDRLRSIRESKQMSQGDLEKRTGLLRCYLSRVECGHTVPSVGTLEKWAAALQVPLYELFYDGEKPPSLAPLRKLRDAHRFEWGSSGSQLFQFRKLQRSLSRMTNRNRLILLSLANRVVSAKRRATSKAA